MAITNRFYIGQVQGSGLETDLRPYAISENAFTLLNNAYVFRGRVRKRFGGQLMYGTQATITGLEQIQSRLKISIGTSNSSTGNFSGTVPGAIFGVGQAFSVGSEFFTVNATGTPANMLATGAGPTGTYNTSTGAVAILGAPANQTVYFYPAQPVMGFGSIEGATIEDEQIVAFDTQFPYKFVANGWDKMTGSMTTPTFTGNNAQFFWTTNFRSSTNSALYFFVTNFNTGTTLSNSDTMYFWNGTDWTVFQPGFNSGTATDTILSARIILQFKSRLILLNVVENTGDSPGTNITYQNRCRYSWIGDPTNSAAFYQDVIGSGGYIDCPTSEAIITAQFLKDRLIVYFEASTWELVYTGNQVLPFVWQQINTELGAESTFSQVPFDKVVLGVGNVGVHACTGNNVERIDDKIPQEVFKIHNDNNGIQRVAGIRDYYTEMVYWTFPSEMQSASFPYNDRVLTYNYKSGAWAFNDDSITAFGYFQSTVDNTLTSLTWAQADTAWQDANFAWTSASTQAKFRNVVAGNQEGYTFIVNSEISSNSQSLQITDIPSYTSLFTASLLVIDHNLSVGDYVKVITYTTSGITGLNGLIFQVITVTDSNNIVLNTSGVAISGTYLGAGTLTRVTPIEFKTKQFNFYAEQGRNSYIPHVDFLIDRTYNGQCTVDFLISSSDSSMITQNALTNTIVGTSVLETSPYALAPFEYQQTRLWHPVYFLAEGEYVQFYFYLSNAQCVDPTISEAAFQLHAMIVHATPTASRLQ